MILRRSFSRILADQPIGRLLVGNQQRELRERRFELDVDRPVSADGGGDVELDLGLRGQAGELYEQLVVDPILPGLTRPADSWVTAD